MAKINIVDLRFDSPNFLVLRQQKAVVRADHALVLLVQQAAVHHLVNPFKIHLSFLVDRHDRVVLALQQRLLLSSHVLRRHVRQLVPCSFEVLVFQFFEVVDDGFFDKFHVVGRVQDHRRRRHEVPVQRVDDGVTGSVVLHALRQQVVL